MLPLLMLSLLGPAWSQEPTGGETVDEPAALLRDPEVLPFISSLGFQAELYF